ncbi:MAG: ABC transporter ATP-binding protein [Chloroflexi bacterium]|nr:ABC transporter ATP-binding protein [Chloroflexota bacterium]
MRHRGRRAGGDDHAAAGRDLGRHALRGRLRSRRGRLQPAHHRAARDGADGDRSAGPLHPGPRTARRERAGGRARRLRRARRGDRGVGGAAGRERQRAPRGAGGPQRRQPARGLVRSALGRAARPRGDGRRRAAAARRPAATRERRGGRGVIEARGLTRRFGGTLALDGVSFEVAEGAKIALLGANGAGKTTLLALLSTLLTPSEGGASVAGHDLASDGAALRASIGVLTHRPMLYEELTPEENLRFFARLYSVGDAGERVEELLRAVGLWLRRDEPTAVLSRGYHQRLAIARALLHRPPVLLLDEPETGLDREALELLDRLVLHAPGLTVLAATHLRERVASWADGVLELERGRLLEGGEVAQASAAAAGAAR